MGPLFKIAVVLAACLACTVADTTLTPGGSATATLDPGCGWSYFASTVPVAGTPVTQLDVSLGTTWHYLFGDVRVYVKWGSKPTHLSYDQSCTADATSSACSISNLGCSQGAGQILYVGVYYTLPVMNEVTIDMTTLGAVDAAPAVVGLTDGVNATLAARLGGDAFLRYTLPAGTWPTGRLQIQMHEQTATGVTSVQFSTLAASVGSRLCVAATSRASLLLVAGLPTSDASLPFISACDWMSLVDANGHLDLAVSVGTPAVTGGAVVSFTITVTLVDTEVGAVPTIGGEVVTHVHSMIYNTLVPTADFVSFVATGLEGAGPSMYVGLNQTAHAVTDPIADSVFTSQPAFQRNPNNLCKTGINFQPTGPACAYGQCLFTLPAAALDQFYLRGNPISFQLAFNIDNVDPAAFASYPISYSVSFITSSYTPTALTPGVALPSTHRFGADYTHFTVEVSQADVDAQADLLVSINQDPLFKSNKMAVFLNPYGIAGQPTSGLTGGPSFHTRCVPYGNMGACTAVVESCMLRAGTWYIAVTPFNWLSVPADDIAWQASIFLRSTGWAEQDLPFTISADLVAPTVLTNNTLVNAFLPNHPYYTRQFVYKVSETAANAVTAIQFDVRNLQTSCIANQINLAVQRGSPAGGPGYSRCTSALNGNYWQSFGLVYSTRVNVLTPGDYYFGLRMTGCFSDFYQTQPVMVRAFESAPTQGPDGGAESLPANTPTTFDISPSLATLRGVGMRQFALDARGVQQGQGLTVRVEMAAPQSDLGDLGFAEAMLYNDTVSHAYLSGCLPSAGQPCVIKVLPYLVQPIVYYLVVSTSALPSTLTVSYTLETPAVTPLIAGQPSVHTIIDANTIPAQFSIAMPATISPTSNLQIDVYPRAPHDSAIAIYTGVNGPVFVDNSYYPAPTVLQCQLVSGAQDLHGSCRIQFSACQLPAGGTLNLGVRVYSGGLDHVAEPPRLTFNVSWVEPTPLVLGVGHRDILLTSRALYGRVYANHYAVQLPATIAAGSTVEFRISSLLVNGLDDRSVSTASGSSLQTRERFFLYVTNSVDRPNQLAGPSLYSWTAAANTIGMIDSFTECCRSTFPDYARAVVRASDDNLSFHGLVTLDPVDVRPGATYYIAVSSAFPHATTPDAYVVSAYIKSPASVTALVDGAPVTGKANRWNPTVYTLHAATADPSGHWMVTFEDLDSSLLGATVYVNVGDSLATQHTFFTHCAAENSVCAFSVMNTVAAADISVAVYASPSTYTAVEFADFRLTVAHVAAIPLVPGTASATQTLTASHTGTSLGSRSVTQVFSIDATAFGTVYPSIFAEFTVVPDPMCPNATITLHASADFALINSISNLLSSNVTNGNVIPVWGNFLRGPTNSVPPLMGAVPNNKLYLAMSMSIPDQSDSVTLTYTVKIQNPVITTVTAADTATGITLMGDATNKLEIYRYTVPATPALPFGTVVSLVVSNGHQTANADFWFYLNNGAPYYDQFLGTGYPFGTIASISLPGQWPTFCSANLAGSVFTAAFRIPTGDSYDVQYTLSPPVELTSTTPASLVATSGDWRVLHIAAPAANELYSLQLDIAYNGWFDVRFYTKADCGSRISASTLLLYSSGAVTTLDQFVRSELWVGVQNCISTSHQPYVMTLRKHTLTAQTALTSGTAHAYTPAFPGDVHTYAVPANVDFRAVIERTDSTPGSVSLVFNDDWDNAFELVHAAGKKVLSISGMAVRTPTVAYTVTLRVILSEDATAATYSVTVYYDPPATIAVGVAQAVVVKGEAITLAVPAASLVGNQMMLELTGATTAVNIHVAADYSPSSYFSAMSTSTSSLPFVFENIGLCYSAKTTYYITFAVPHTSAVPDVPFTATITTAGAVTLGHNVTSTTRTLSTTGRDMITVDNTIPRPVGSTVRVHVTTTCSALRIGFINGPAPLPLPSTACGYSPVLHDMSTDVFATGDDDTRTFSTTFSFCEDSTDASFALAVFNAGGISTEYTLRYEILSLEIEEIFLNVPVYVNTPGTNKIYVLRESSPYGYATFAQMHGVAARFAFGAPFGSDTATGYECAGYEDALPSGFPMYWYPLTRNLDGDDYGIHGDIYITVINENSPGTPVIGSFVVSDKYEYRFADGLHEADFAYSGQAARQPRTLIAGVPAADTTPGFIGQMWRIELETTLSGGDYYLLTLRGEAQQLFVDLYEEGEFGEDFTLLNVPSTYQRLQFHYYVNDHRYESSESDGVFAYPAGHNAGSVTITIPALELGKRTTFMVRVASPGNHARIPYTIEYEVLSMPSDTATGSSSVMVLATPTAAAPETTYCGALPNTTVQAFTMLMPDIAANQQLRVALRTENGLPFYGRDTEPAHYIDSSTNEFLQLYATVDNAVHVGPQGQDSYTDTAFVVNPYYSRSPVSHYFERPSRELIKAKRLNLVVMGVDSRTKSFSLAISLHTFSTVELKPNTLTQFNAFAGSGLYETENAGAFGTVKAPSLFSPLRFTFTLPANVITAHLETVTDSPQDLTSFMVLYGSAPTFMTASGTYGAYSAMENVYGPGDLNANFNSYYPYTSGLFLARPGQYGGAVQIFYDRSGAPKPIGIVLRYTVAEPQTLTLDGPAVTAISDDPSSSWFTFTVPETGAELYVNAETGLDEYDGSIVIAYILLDDAKVLHKKVELRQDQALPFRPVSYPDMSTRYSPGRRVTVHFGTYHEGRGNVPMTRLATLPAISTATPDTPVTATEATGNVFAIDLADAVVGSAVYLTFAGPGTAFIAESTFFDETSPPAQATFFVSATTKTAYVFVDYLSTFTVHVDAPVAATDGLAHTVTLPGSGSVVFAVPAGQAADFSIAMSSPTFVRISDRSAAFNFAERQVIKDHLYNAPQGSSIVYSHVDKGAINSGGTSYVQITLPKGPNEALEPCYFSEGTQWTTTLTITVRMGASLVQTADSALCGARPGVYNGDNTATEKRAQATFDALYREAACGPSPFPDGIELCQSFSTACNASLLEYACAASYREVSSSGGFLLDLCSDTCGNVFRDCGPLFAGYTSLLTSSCLPASETECSGTQNPTTGPSTTDSGAGAVVATTEAPADGDKTGMIVGIVLGVFFFLVIVAAIAYFVIRRRRAAVNLASATPKKAEAAGTKKKPLDSNPASKKSSMGDGVSRSTAASASVSAASASGSGSP